ncbi:hypothetical protein BX616_001070 [Lobosporangium transversale]|nr:hypothetical protein BX616_001070 [Lobosporangium transversale]
MICGITYKKTGSGYSRSVHLTQRHGGLYSTLQEFRSYQGGVKGIMPPPSPEEVGMPRPPRKARLDIARNAIVDERLKKPLPLEQEVFKGMLLLYIASNRVTFDAINSTIFRAAIEMVNPHLDIPVTATMQDKMDRQVRGTRREIKEYIASYDLYAAVAMDC